MLKKKTVSTALKISNRILNRVLYAYLYVSFFSLQFSALQFCCLAYCDFELITLLQKTTELLNQKTKDFKRKLTTYKLKTSFLQNRSMSTMVLLSRIYGRKTKQQPTAISLKNIKKVASLKKCYLLFRLCFYYCNLKTSDGNDTNNNTNENKRNRCLDLEKVV